MTNGYKFHHSETDKKTIMGKCSEKRCKSTCNADLDNASLLRSPEERGRSVPHRPLILKHRIRAACTRRVTKDTLFTALLMHVRDTPMSEKIDGIMISFDIIIRFLKLSQRHLISMNSANKSVDLVRCGRIGGMMTSVVDLSRCS